MRRKNLTGTFDLGTLLPEISAMEGCLSARCREWDGRYAPGHAAARLRPSNRVRKPIPHSASKNALDSVNKSWAFRYVRHDKQSRMGLGPYPDMSLAEARELATQECKKLLRGIDPLTDKRARLMADWACYCSKPAKVIAIRQSTV